MKCTECGSWGPHRFWCREPLRQPSPETVARADADELAMTQRRATAAVADSASGWRIVGNGVSFVVDNAAYFSRPDTTAATTALRQIEKQLINGKVEEMRARFDAEGSGYSDARFKWAATTPLTTTSESDSSLRRRALDAYSADDSIPLDHKLSHAFVYATGAALDAAAARVGVKRR